MEQHKHHDLIVAWAKGATIQWQSPSGEWETIFEPSWGKEFNYRIQPEPKPDIIKLVHVNLYGYVWNDGSDVWEYEPKNLRLVLDGETGVLKSAEVINDR